MLRFRVFYVKVSILFAFNDVVKELASLHVLHDEKKLFGSFNDFIQLNDAGMPY